LGSLLPVITGWLKYTCTVHKTVGTMNRCARICVCYSTQTHWVWRIV